MNNQGTSLRVRAIYLVALVIIIAAGLSCRHVAWLPHSTGDMLWSMMVFCFIRLPFVRWSSSTVAWVTAAISFADEFSQLIRWPWLCQIRSTAIGHLILGQGFLWQDLVAYVIAVGLMYCFDRIAYQLSYVMRK